MLIGCERSGVIRHAFRRMGHDAWSCDLAPSEDGSKFHLQGDVLAVLTQHAWVGENAPKAWDIFGVHPSCQFLNSAGMHWTSRGKRDPIKTQEAILFAERCWEAGRQHAKSMFLENPVGVLSTRSNLGKPQQIIQPYEFGEDASKSTCLWLHNLPSLTGTKFVPPRMFCRACKACYHYQGEVKDCCPNCGAEAAKHCLPRWGNQTDSGQNRLAPSATRWMDRSRTYEGIAYAMAKQWGGIA